MTTIKNNLKSKRSGMVLIYSMGAMAMFTGMCALAVDWGRVQLAKTELQSAADSAARGGAGALRQDPATAAAVAKWTATKNNADGSAVDVSNAADMQLGSWDTTTLQFTQLFGGDLFHANACRVVARRDAARGNGVGMSFASLFGARSRTVTAESVAMWISPVNVDQSVLATSNPFLAGMPAGSIASVNNPHANPDYAGTTANPKQSPAPVNLPLKDGAALTFDSISGTARHDPSLSDYQPDGQLDDINHNTAGSENGIADATIPINALVGIFLDDNAPDKSAAPKSLDFSSSQSRDFDSLQPQLKQIFFIGDGLNSKGVQQKFIVPKGATRLYLATWDFYEWNNNSGNRVVKVERPEQIITVK